MCLAAPLRKLVIMNVKKVIVNIIVLILSFLIFAVWYQTSVINSAQTVSAPIESYKVYLITTDKEFQYWTFMDKGASDMAKAAGIQYIWDAPEKRNVNKQIEIINKAVEDGANALLVAADDPKEITEAIEDAKAKGVKVIYVDSPANEEAITTLATNNYAAGLVAGQTMLSLLEKVGINSGSIGILSIPGKENSAERESGFREVLQADNRFMILNTVFTNGDSEITKEATERIINDNKDLVALYATNEGTSIGIGNAIKANDNRFIGVGYDATDEMLQLLHDGSIKAIINQNPYTMGYLGMAEAIAAIFGKNTGPSYIDTGISVVQ